jgi:hypothetical protein
MTSDTTVADVRNEGRPMVGSIISGMVAGCAGRL